MAICPVCKTECGDNAVCSHCGFNGIGKMFISQEDADEWFNRVVSPYRMKLEQKKSIKKYIEFGQYYNSTMKKEPIKWNVLDVQNDKQLIVTQKLIDCQQFHFHQGKFVTWENSDIRKWLNEHFYYTAFNSFEKDKIIESHLLPDKNPDADKVYENETDDRIFLLSLTEINKYFPDSSSRKCKPTKYAIKSGAIYMEGEDCSNAKPYWTRTIGFGATERSMLIVNAFGEVDLMGHMITSRYIMVRPAMWIKRDE